MDRTINTGTRINVLQVQIAASLDELARHLPFASPSVNDLQQALTEAARKYYQPHRAQEFVGLSLDVQDISTQLLRYIRQLPESAGLNAITTQQALLEDFIDFLTQPLIEAHREVASLERRTHDELSSHKAQRLSLADFSRNLDHTVELIKDYAALADTLIHDARSMRRRVQVLDVIFVDPRDYILKMRTTLHDLSNILEVQRSSARGVIEFKDTDTTRTKYFKSMCSTFDAKLDPFLRIKTAYPHVGISIPRHRFPIPEPETLQSILHHLIQNAVKHGAGRIAVSLMRRNEDFATIAVMDDGPGIPADIQEKLGRQIIGDSSGWYIMKNELVPQLGRDAEISFISPHRDGRGTLVKITMPISSPAGSPRGPSGKPPRTPAPERNDIRDAPSSEGLATVHDITSATGSPTDIYPPQSQHMAGALGMTGAQTGVILNFPMISFKAGPR